MNPAIFGPSSEKNFLMSEIGATLKPTTYKIVSDTDNTQKFNLKNS